MEGLLCPLVHVWEHESMPQKLKQKWHTHLLAPVLCPSSMIHGKSSKPPQLKKETRQVVWFSFAPSLLKSMRGHLAVHLAKSNPEGLILHGLLVEVGHVGLSERAE